MKTRELPTPTSRVRFGLARADITPPVGIYHRLWGAARHSQATGVHRPGTARKSIRENLIKNGMFYPFRSMNLHWFLDQSEL